ncbi:MAG: hypothetical protein R3217_06555 [Gammaproteobacteria bacterium]|nr:hypothetical protein [Gammaproteobacteria bacterium]
MNTDPPKLPGVQPLHPARADFEAMRLPPGALDHRGLLVLGVQYLLEYPEPVAIDRLLTALMRYQANLADLPGRARYHETRTLFWLRITRGCVAEVERRLGTRVPAEVATCVLERWGDRADYIEEFYSPRCLRQWQAVYGWVEPDRAPLPAADQQP